MDSDFKLLDLNSAIHVVDLLQGQIFQRVISPTFKTIEVHKFGHWSKRFLFQKVISTNWFYFERSLFSGNSFFFHSFHRLRFGEMTFLQNKNPSEKWLFRIKTAWRNDLRNEIFGRNYTSKYWPALLPLTLQVSKHFALCKCLLLSNLELKWWILS